MQYGLVHIYQGDGKGKTTAAAGLCLRASGAGRCVGWASFLKDGSSSEITALGTLDNLTLFPFLPEVTFTFCMTDKKKKEAAVFYEALLCHMEQELDTLDLLVLDEILDAVQTGLVEEATVLRLIERADSKTELVLTGRCATPSLAKKAAYITEMRAVRHPYDNGVAARRGIEY